MFPHIFVKNKQGLDRGHLVPSQIMNFDKEAMKSTFSLTNVAPQYSIFNQQAWKQLECVVNNYLEKEWINRSAYIITGTE